MADHKLKLDDLHYIVMEGGGARGAAYLGAIRGLETAMDRNFEHSVTGGRQPGLLDYHEVGHPDKLLIKGIAGSSAGAITTFALGLGLNSAEIEKILKYPFAKFLEEKDAGKYRAIDDEGRLAIGQDVKNQVTDEQELHIDSKFEFRFDRDATSVGGNPAKLALRNLYFTLGTKVLVDGMGTNIDQLFNLQSKIGNAVSSNNNISSFWKSIWSFFLRANNSFLQKLGWQKVLNLLLFKVLLPKLLKAPMNFDVDTFTNLISDRGMYSGFAVREFFLDVMIYAATRDTRFQRGLLKQFETETATASADRLKMELNQLKDFIIGKRSVSKLTTAITNPTFFQKLSNITFREFQEIVGVNFGVCVSNFTTGFPLYFGSEWSPDFRVMEAVACSMTIPPAIKPLYNESNVVQPEDKKVSILVDGKPVTIVDDKGRFDVEKYYFYQHIVKMALAQIISVGKGAFVNVNNTIDLSTFLPQLREIVMGEIKEGIPTRLAQPVNGSNYVVTYPVYRFFYNAAFKGLLLDGGYRNNIPYNFFREHMDEVFALKLDEHLPPPLIDAIYEAIREAVKRVNASQLIAQYEYLIGDTPTAEVLNQLALSTNVVREAVEVETRKEFDKYLEAWTVEAKNDNQKSTRKENHRQLDIPLTQQTPTCSLEGWKITLVPLRSSSGDFQLRKRAGPTWRSCVGQMASDAPGAREKRR